MDRLSLGAVVIYDASSHLELAEAPPSAHDGETAECARCLYGDGVVRGRVAGARAFQRSDPFEFRAQLLGKEILLAPASFRMWDGRVHVGGGARVEGDTWHVELTSEGSDLSYAGTGLSGRLGYRARLVGPVDALRLEVGAQVKGGQIDLFRLQALANGQPAHLGPLDLQLDLDIENFRLSARSLLDAEIAGDLRVTGALGQLQASGEVQVVREYFGYLGRRFEILRGRALFPGGGVVPHLEVTGSVPTQGVTLYVDAVGLADDLSLSARTDPPVDADRLRAMMMEPLGGDPTEIGGDWRRLAAILSSAINRQVVSEFYWTIGRALEDALDIDLVAITPQGDRGLQLTLGKYVRSDLFLTYRRDLIHGLQEGVSLEYSLSPSSVLRTTWDRERGAGLDLGVSVPF